MDRVDWRAARTQDEVAEIMTQRGYPMSRQRVQQIELRALAKLRKMTEIRKAFEEFVEEDPKQ